MILLLSILTLCAPSPFEQRVALLQSYYATQEAMVANGADEDDLATLKARYQATWDKIPD